MTDGIYKHAMNSWRFKFDFERDPVTGKRNTSVCPPAG
jgi:hypothetical protein